MTNRLNSSHSRYLLQHAEDPVNWQPWDDQALEEAASRDVPLFISIGYSACHWCHVMARETFRNHKVAALLNEHFICIKIDREERPDLDAVYLEALIAQQGSGGWPISVFATSDGAPVYCATYLPPRSTHHLPGFYDIASRIAELASGESENFHQASSKALAALTTPVMDNKNTQVSIDNIDAVALMEAVMRELLARYDHDFGGFGDHPKFPQPYLLNAAWWASTTSESQPAIEMRGSITKTLKAMARGGIADHLAGGFFRYSTDRFWMVPHFEKMLYDQSGLLEVYARVAADTHDTELAYVAEEIHRFVTEQMTLPSGLLAASTDADANDEEGAYYLFRGQEINSVLGEEAPAFVEYYGITKAGNFEGQNIVHRPVDATIVPPASLNPLRLSLQAYRSGRMNLGRDDKALCDWNAQWATALLRAGRHLDRSEWRDKALELAVIIDKAFRDDTNLWHCSYSGDLSIAGFSSDYVCFGLMCLEAFQVCGDIVWLERAQGAADHLIEHFTNEDPFGFTIATNHSNIPAHLQDRYDAATASTHSLATLFLNRLGIIRDDNRYRQVAIRAMEALSNLVVRSPASFSVLAWAIYETGIGTIELVIPGTAPSPLRDVAVTSSTPNLLLVQGSGSPLTRDRREGWAYLCHNRVCELPTDDPEALRSALEPRKERKTS
ncbi:MAG: thioredoxin domain-containing protein [Ferrimicrobium sp.]